MASAVIISLCDFTGNMVKPWADAGFKCYCFAWLTYSLLFAWLGLSHLAYIQKE